MREKRESLLLFISLSLLFFRTTRFLTGELSRASFFVVVEQQTMHHQYHETKKKATLIKSVYENASELNTGMNETNHSAVAHDTQKRHTNINIAVVVVGSSQVEESFRESVL